MGLLTARTSTKQLALDWDARTIRAVMVRVRGGRLDVLKAASIPVDPDVSVQDATAFGRFLRDALDQAGISGRATVIGISRDRVVLNTLPAPPTPDPELAALVRFQMERELPFAAGEAVLDFAVRNADAGKPRELLVAAIRRDMLDYYRAVATEAGLKLARLGLRPHANLEAVTAKAPEMSSGLTLVVDIGPELTEIDIVLDGHLAFSRAASVRLPRELIEPEAGGARIDDSRIFSRPVTDSPMSEPPIRVAVDELLIEVTRSVEAYRAIAAGARIDRIVVAGATGAEAAFCEAARERLGAEARLYDPGRALDLAAPRARELRGFSAALGLAMGHGRNPYFQIDFLKPKQPVAKRVRKLQRARLVGLAAAFVLFGGYLALNAVKAADIEELELIRQDVDALRPVKDQHELVEAELVALRNWLGAEQLWLDDLLRITRAIPDNSLAYVSNLNMNETSMIDVKIRTKETAIGLDFRRKLNEIGGYHAESGPAVPEPGADGFQYTEQIKVIVKADARAAPPTGGGRSANERATPAGSAGGAKPSDAGGAAPTTRPATSAEDAEAEDELLDDEADADDTIEESAAESDADSAGKDEDSGAPEDAAGASEVGSSTATGGGNGTQKGDGRP
ncbi:MAG: pilus assembly protein PilM [Phycisphaerae bacterium]|nr:pilus assembly protein PilM [Phycisphaerae bacterium]